jgi:hypothetical protein
MTNTLELNTIGLMVHTDYISFLDLPNDDVTIKVNPCHF